jgi:hypothetical protein
MPVGVSISTATHITTAGYNGRVAGHRSCAQPVRGPRRTAQPDEPFDDALGDALLLSKQALECAAAGGGDELCQVILAKPVPHPPATMAAGGCADAGSCRSGLTLGPLELLYRSDQRLRQVQAFGVSPAKVHPKCQATG